MKYIHSNKIIHSNLKPSNILIGKDGFIKISDISINKLKPTKISNNVGIGSLFFTAPEILNNRDYNEKADVYSFGVIVYFIINGGELPKTSFIELPKTS